MLQRRSWPMKKVSLFITFLLLGYHFAIARQTLPADVRFGRISTEKGLSQAKVYVSFQDSQGYLWFGTEDGLNKYDGYNFEVYKYNPTDARSISSNIIRCIYEDSRQNLWIGTDNGLNTYQRTNGTFTRYYQESNKPNTLSNNIISSITEDKNGVVWIGTGDGLNKYDAGSNTFSRISTIDKEEKSLNQITSLGTGLDGQIWIGTVGRGLIKYDPKNGTAQHFLNKAGDKSSLSENEISCIYIDPKGSVWAGTVNNGVNQLKPGSEKFIRYDQSTGLSNNSVFTVTSDQQGMFWIGTLGGGVDVLEQNSNRSYHFRNNPQNQESISSNKIWHILEDNAGTLWFSTSDGISYFNRTIEKFKTYSIGKKGEAQSNNSVYAIHEDEKGNIWTGILGGGLNVFSRQEDRFVNERFPILNNPALRFANVFAITQDLNKKIWLGTNDGLLSADLSSGTIKSFRNTSNDPLSLSNNYVRCLLRDREGKIWIGTHGGGLNILDPVTEKIQSYRHVPGNSSSLSSDVVLEIYEDRDGIIWIATYGGGLNRFDKSGQKFSSFQNDPNNPRSISSNYIHTVHQDKNGKYWIGTYGAGISILQMDKQSFNHFTENDGLPNNIINGIAEDGKGNFWISTNSGVCKLTVLPGEPLKALTRTYGKADGLQNKFNENACYAGKGGWLYFGGSQGLNVFHPDNINDNLIVPPVVITRFYLFEKPARMDTLITSKRSLELSYKQNFFSFEFAALNFLLPDKNRYAYKMEGLNEEWIYSGNRRYATYTNIDPGRYIFRVKASNNDGIWNEEGIAIEITITPPFWKTWWFTAIAALLITLLIFVYIRIRTNSLVKQNIVLEEKVNQRTHELQEKNVELTMTMDHLQATQTQLIQSEKMASLGQLTAGIAHEIQNPLNFVNNFSELSVELLEELENSGEKDTKEEIVGNLKQNLNKIVFHGKRADSIVKGMLQHSRASAAEKTSTDINKLVEEFFNLAYHGMRAKDPAFNCKMEKHLEAGLPHPAIIPQDISRVILNIFNNAFYAVDERKKSEDSTYQPTVSISTALENRYIRISIRDNGKGIPAAIKDKIFNPFFTTKPTGSGTGLGLSISYDIIVKGHGGELSVESERGSFSEFIIKLPVLT